MSHDESEAPSKRQLVFLRDLQAVTRILLHLVFFADTL